MKSLKDFKREIQALGYKVRTYVNNYGSIGVDGNYRQLEVLDKNKNFICGAGASCYGRSHIDKHSRVFELLKRNRGKVYELDKKGRVIAKVMF